MNSTQGHCWPHTSTDHGGRTTPFFPTLSCAPHPSPQGHRVVVMDIRGAGDSSLGFTDYSPLAVARDAAEVLRQLAPPPGPAGVVVMGNSFAG